MLSAEHLPLGEIKRLLAERGLAPQRRFGQNFLHDRNLCDWMARHTLGLEALQTHLGGGTESAGKVESAAVAGSVKAGAAELSEVPEAEAEGSEPMHIWEVGPGLGALTSALLLLGAKVSAIEIDRGFIPVLLERFAVQIESGQFTLHEGDALELAPRLFPKDVRLASNLPYNIATPLLLELACGENVPLRIVGTVQMEAAERFLARPGHAAYNAVSVVLQALYECGPLKKLPSQVFYPVPEVVSAIVTLMRRDPLPVELCSAAQRGAFSGLLRGAFSAKRKRAVAALGNAGVAVGGEIKSRLEWEAIFAGAEVDSALRAEQIGVPEWLKIFQYVQKVGGQG